MPSKEIWFVRHGLSRANVPEIHEAEFVNPHNNDAHLHHKGIEQAKIQTLDIPDGAHIVCSPLTRALDTAVMGCSFYGGTLTGKNKRIVVHPLVAECLIDISCVGTRKSKLESKYRVIQELTGHEIDFSNVTKEHWWDDGDIAENGRICDLQKSSEQLYNRIREFMKYIQSRPEPVCVVFSHHTFITEFIRLFTGKNVGWLDNCGLIRFTLA